MEEEIAEGDAGTADGHKRAVKHTEKSVEERLYHHINMRRGKLKQMTAKMKEMEQLMENDCNLEDVKSRMEQLKTIGEEFKERNSSVLLYLNEGEKSADQDDWFTPKVARLQDFVEKANVWIKDAEKCKEKSQPQQSHDEVTHMDSVSMVSRSAVSRASSGRSRASSASSARLREEANRAEKSAMSEESKHPIIMPNDMHPTMLLLRDIHEKVGHSGRNHMLSRLRHRFWIPAANSAARKLISRCVTCRKIQAKAHGQKMADLPADRLLPEKPPFTGVGVDYFGPIEVKRGRSIVKRYGVLFTCLTTRAVHLEVSHTLDTDSCINALHASCLGEGKFSSSDQTTALTLSVQIRSFVHLCSSGI